MSATSSQITVPEITQIQEMHTEIHHSALEQTAIPSETSLGRLFLLRGSMSLTKLPKDVEWEVFKEICLMDNELTELPKNLRCLKVQALFLQRNLKLRSIPHSFFSHMVDLQILNLSRTRIKSLPDSLFGLVKLKRLFLNYCELLLKLPSKVGELKCLEVLDLEGTTIMALPKEVEQLTNLTSLEVSFCEYTSHWRSEPTEMVIPDGVILALSQLEELNIDVSPEDVRWNESVEELVSEVCRLTALDTLKLYFPKVELLGYFQWDNMPMECPSLSHFRFIVGDHTKRIISRLPRDVEFELDRYDKCLKYVNGEGEPEEIKKVLRHASAFFLDRHKNVRMLSDFGITNMIQLECCVVGECDELQAIVDGDTEASAESEIGLLSLEYLYIYYVKSLRCVWKGQVDDRSFILLKYLTLYMCPEMTTIFAPELLANLCSLEELTIDDCPEIRKLVSCDDSELTPKHVLPSLKKISLRFLPILDSIFDILLISPRMEWMSFYFCPKLKSLPIIKAFNKNLRKIKGERNWWQRLNEWESNEKDYWGEIFTAVNERECITTYSRGISAKS